MLDFYDAVSSKDNTDKAFEQIDSNFGELTFGYKAKKAKKWC